MVRSRRKSSLMQSTLGVYASETFSRILSLTVYERRHFDASFKSRNNNLFLILNIAIAFQLTRIIYLFSPNARRRRRPFESAQLHFLPHGWLRVKITILRQAWWSKESRSMRLTRRKYPDWHARRSIYFGEAIARGFRERTNDKKLIKREKLILMSL